jgi:hypothetical protein
MDSLIQNFEELSHYSRENKRRKETALKSTFEIVKT